MFKTNVFHYLKHNLLQAGLWLSEGSRTRGQHMVSGSPEQLWAAWNCSTSLGDVDPKSPVGDAVVLPSVRGINSLCPGLKHEQL